MHSRLPGHKLRETILHGKSKRIPAGEKATFAYTESNYFLVIPEDRCVAEAREFNRSRNRASICFVV
jgi:hypothetical protein